MNHQFWVLDEDESRRALFQPRFKWRQSLKSTRMKNHFLRIREWLPIVTIISSFRLPEIPLRTGIEIIAALYFLKKEISFRWWASLFPGIPSSIYWQFSFVSSLKGAELCSHMEVNPFLCWRWQGRGRWLSEWLSQMLVGTPKSWDSSQSLSATL